MSSFNLVVLMGNLTRTPQLRFLPNQTPVVDLGLACNSKFRTAAGEDREEVMFIDCVAYGKQAEVINQHFDKGRPILVRGKLTLDSWDDKQTGQKRSKHKVTIDQFSFVGKRDAAPGQSGESAESNQDAVPW